MERNDKGQFIKGHTGWNKGIGWRNEKRTCKCGKVFNPNKKFQKSCSQHCAMRLRWATGKGNKLFVKGHKSFKGTEKTRFKKGHTPWNVGTKGLVRGYWTGKHRIEMTGERSHLWRGGITPINEKIRKSVEYKIWRRKVFERDNWTCVLCGKKFIKGITGRVKLHADHIKAFSKYKKLRFDLNNGRTLCKICHLKTDNYGTKAIK